MNYPSIHAHASADASAKLTVPLCLTTLFQLQPLNVPLHSLVCERVSLHPYFLGTQAEVKQIYYELHILQMTWKYCYSYTSST